MQSHKNASPSFWTGFVRITHWLVAIGVVVNFFNDTGYWHRVLGYSCVIFVLLRILYGLTSSIQSSKFYLPSFHHLRAHFSELLSGKFQHHAGHNPLGQWAVYIMWTLIMSLAITGWLSRTDAYWGEDWPVDLHIVFSDVLQGFVVLHLLAVIVMSKLQRQNLIKKMIK